jgi:hypothetical protein
MPTDLPLNIVIVEVVRHTPPWVWGLLAALVAFGLAQTRRQEVGRLRVTIMPLAMSVLSLYGAFSAFGLRGAVLLAWAMGTGLMLWAGPRWPRAVRHLPATDRFVVDGSVLPLAAMLAIFVVRYAVNVMLVLHHAWAVQPAFATAASFAYGLLSGLFAVRARHILAGAAESRSGTATA